MEVDRALVPTLAATLEKRRREVHVQCLRSLAQSNPRALAAVIARWLREDERWPSRR